MSWSVLRCTIKYQWHRLGENVHGPYSSAFGEVLLPAGTLSLPSWTMTTLAPLISSWCPWRLSEAVHSFNFLPGKQMVRCMNFSKVCREVLEVAAVQAATGHFSPLRWIGVSKGKFSLWPCCPSTSGASWTPREVTLKVHSAIPCLSSHCTLAVKAELISSTSPYPFSNLDSKNTDNLYSFSFRFDSRVWNAVIASLGFSCLKSSLPASKTEREISPGKCNCEVLRWACDIATAGLPMLELHRSCTSLSQGFSEQN